MFCILRGAPKVHQWDPVQMILLDLASLMLKLEEQFHSLFPKGLAEFLNHILLDILWQLLPSEYQNL